MVKLESICLNCGVKMGYPMMEYGDASYLIGDIIRETSCNDCGKVAVIKVVSGNQFDCG